MLLTSCVMLERNPEMQQAAKAGATVIISEDSTED